MQGDGTKGRKGCTVYEEEYGDVVSWGTPGHLLVATGNGI